MIFGKSKALLAAVAVFCAVASSGIASAQGISIHAGRHGVTISNRWRGWHSRAEMFAHRHWNRRRRMWVYDVAPGYRNRHRWH